MPAHKHTLAHCNHAGHFSKSQWPPEANYIIVLVTRVIYEEIYFTVAFICLLWYTMCFVAGFIFCQCVRSNTTTWTLFLSSVLHWYKVDEKEASVFIEYVTNATRKHIGHVFYIASSMRVLITSHCWINTHICRLLSYLQKNIHHFWARLSAGIKMYDLTKPLRMWQLKLCVMNRSSFWEEVSGLNSVTLANSDLTACWSQTTTLAPRSPPFKLLSKRIFHFFDSTWSPLGSCKSRNHRWFSYPHRGGRGFTEFLCVLWAQGDSVCCLQDWYYHTERGLERVQTDPTPANQTHLTFTCTYFLAIDNTSGLCFQPSACYSFLIICVWRHQLAQKRPNTNWKKCMNFGGFVYLVADIPISFRKCHNFVLCAATA